MPVRSVEGHVLVVDDDPIVRDVLGRYLAREGFGVSSAGDGRAALAAIHARHPDLVLLDLMLPSMDGFEVFRRLRAADETTAVIMITARGQETDRVVGLESGADDYVAKPFSPREVVARVRAVLRRTGNGADRAEPRPEPLRFPGLEIDPGAREVVVEGERVALTPREFDLLHFLAEHPRIAFSRLQLLDELWDVAYDGDPSTVTVHVRRLREKIESEPSSPRRLVTVWGAGYRFEP
jgi:DNA-binding response OmpR family regulator